jgi:hypothetical protein
VSLLDKYEMVRDALIECTGYRVLGDNDVLQAGDETACASMLFGYYEQWQTMDDEFADYFGQTVAWANDEKRDEMDATERLFRRKDAHRITEIAKEAT